MANLAKLAFGFGVVALVAAFLIVPMIDTANNPSQQTIELQEGQSTLVTDRLEATNQEVQIYNQSSGAKNVTLQVENTQTTERNTTTLNVSEGDKVRLSGENVTLKVNSISQENTTNLEITYPSTFGFDDGAATFWSNTGLLLVILAFMFLIGVIGAMMKA